MSLKLKTTISFVPIAEPTSPPASQLVDLTERLPSPEPPPSPGPLPAALESLPPGPPLGLLPPKSLLSPKSLLPVLSSPPPLVDYEKLRLSRISVLSEDLIMDYCDEMDKKIPGDGSDSSRVLAVLPAATVALATLAIAAAP
jgi:hypothetical protein